MNFLSNIGWNYGDNEEIFSTAQAIKRFDLKEVNPANSAYPIAKLDWLNSQYIQHAEIDELCRVLKPILENAGYSVDGERLKRVAPLLRVRLKSLNDVVPMAGFFFADWAAFNPPATDILIQRKMDHRQTAEVLRGSIPVLERIEDFGPDTQYVAMAAYAKAIGFKNGQVFGTLRAAVTGQRVSPPTFETMEILGKAESLRRIELAFESLTREMT